MTQPTIEDFQVDLTNSLKGKIDLNDLKDVSAPNPGDGETILWNNTSSKWEPGAGGSGGGVQTSYYFELNGVTGAAITMPAGWSSSSPSAGVYTLTHNLNSTNLGFAMMTIGATTIAALNISSVSANAITFKLGFGVDPSSGTVGGRIIAEDNSAAPTTGGPGGNAYIKIAANGTGLVLPVGWTSAKVGTGEYIITHNLGTEEVGYALAAIPPDVTLGFIITTKTTNSVTLRWANGLADSTFDGTISVAGGLGGSVIGSGNTYKAMDNGIIHYRVPFGSIAIGASLVVPLPIANNQGILLTAGSATPIIFNGELGFGGIVITAFSTTSITLRNDNFVASSGGYKIFTAI